MTVIVSLDELKAHLNNPSSTDDDELVEMLDAAEEVVGDLTNYGSVAYTETLYVSDGTVVLSHTPVVSVTAVTSAGEAITGTTVSAYGLLSGLRGWRQVTVTYTAGIAVPSARLRLATLIVAAHLFETQRMPGQSLDSRPAGFGGVDGIPDATPFRGFAIPNRALELLQSYIPTGVVA